MFKTAHKTTHSRSGVASVEFAVVAPVVVIIFLGSISAMAQISLRRNLQVVAYSAATEVSDASNTIPTVKSHFEDFADEIGVRNVNISISLHEDRIYLVEATATQAGNNPIPSFGSSDSLTARCYVYR